MCALLARHPQHQGVRHGAGAERGRAAGAGLHPEETGGDAAGQGKENRGGGGGLNQSRPTDPGSDYLALILTRTILLPALTRGSRATICVSGGGGKKNKLHKSSKPFGVYSPSGTEPRRSVVAPGSAPNTESVSSSEKMPLHLSLQMVQSTKLPQLALVIKCHFCR